VDLLDKTYHSLRRAGFDVQYNVKFPDFQRPVNLLAVSAIQTIGVVVRERSGVDPASNPLSLINVLGSQARTLRHRVHLLWYVTDFELSDEEHKELRLWEPFLQWIHADEVDGKVKQLASHMPASTSPVFSYPIWPDRSEMQPHTAFVLMPLTAQWSEAVYSAIGNAAEREKWAVSRADELKGNWVMRDIWKSIQKAEIVIVDLTGRNPNVFYELGIAHTLGRKSLLLAQDADDIPFDVLGLRTIIYDWNSPESYGKLVRQVREQIKSPSSEAT